MGLRLTRWWRRGDAPAGRHARARPTPVPPIPSVQDLAPVPPQPVAPEPVTSGVAPVADEPAGSLPAPAAGTPVDPAYADPPYVQASHVVEPAHVDTAYVEVPHVATAVQPTAVRPTVGLVFADGTSVELDSDDARVRTFRAAAAALLEQPPR